MLKIDTAKETNYQLVKDLEDLDRKEKELRGKKDFILNINIYKQFFEVAIQIFIDGPTEKLIEEHE